MISHALRRCSHIRARSTCQARLHIDAASALSHFKELAEEERCHEHNFVHSQCSRMNMMVTNMLKTGSANMPQSDAEVHAIAAVKSAEELPGLHLHHLTARRNLMMVFVARTKLNEAVTAGRQAVAESRSLLGSKHPMTVSLLLEFANATVEAGDMPMAEELLREAATSCVCLFGEAHMDSLNALTLLGQVCAVQQKFGDAQSALRASLRICRRLHGEGTPMTLSTGNSLAAVLLEVGDFDEAEKLLQHHLHWCEEIHGPESEETQRAAELLISSHERRWWRPLPTASATANQSTNGDGIGNGM